MNCKAPDRDVPSMVCGYPLPCPHHTIELDVGAGQLVVPAARAREPAGLVALARLGNLMADLGEALFGLDDRPPRRRRRKGRKVSPQRRGSKPAKRRSRRRGSSK